MLEYAKTQIDHAITRDDLKGHSFENAFGGATSFLRRKYTKDLSGVELAVTGVPFDQAVTNRPGARFGPRAIREASTLQTFDPPYRWPVDPMTDVAMCDYGDLAFDYADVAAFPVRLEAHVAGILGAGAACLALGGDHSVTYPILKAHAAVHGPLAVVQFDAHSDTWPDGDPKRIDHGTMMTKAIRDGIVDVERSVQVGIRTTNAENPVPEIDALTVHEIGPVETARRIREAVGDARCYVTFDIDCLDPAFAPGTGTPVWGGLSSAQAQRILLGLAGMNVVGMDVVEVSPPYDPTGCTAVAGAHVATDLACLWAAGARGR
ncbi:agmatinase [Hasllibacter halocynthiae]|uniref:Agmatinase n=1 Tax=Hasllibacter halocynthiae TaxID=595589 RepID=A0A2T0X7N2_9RHOB|nr:agmatinase [Hasllibacter halocynthiae]PRY94948.1 agmatinase [Hasllibacter halocynthiae]